MLHLYYSTYSIVQRSLRSFGAEKMHNIFLMDLLVVAPLLQYVSFKNLSFCIFQRSLGCVSFLLYLLVYRTTYAQALVVAYVRIDLFSHCILLLPG